MMLSLSLHDRLLELLGIFDQNRRVLEVRPVQQLAELLVLAGLERRTAAR